MLHLVLADSELETVPQEIADEDLIKRKAKEKGKNPTEILLNSNFHHTAMGQIDDSGRRGRPDIVHVCMLYALESPLNKEKKLKFYVHTRQNKIIDVDPETHIPRSFNRFEGLMEQLLKRGEVPPGNPLMKVENKTLSEKIGEIDPEKTVVFSQKGKKLETSSLFGAISGEEDFCAVVGGFPSGRFLSDVDSICDETIRIYPKSLNAISVLGHMIQLYEERYLPDILSRGEPADEQK